MGAPRKAALALGLGVLAAAPAAGRAQELGPPEIRMEEGKAAPAEVAPPSPLRGGAEPDQTAASASEHAVPGTGQADDSTPSWADPAPSPVPVALPSPVEAPSLVLDEPSPASPAAEPATTGSGANPALEPAAVAAPIAAPDAGGAPASPPPASALKAEQEQAAQAKPAPNDPFGIALAARLGGDEPLHPRLAKREREALAAFYAIGDYQPVWIKAGAWTPAAQAVIERLRLAAEDGLDAGEYPVPALGAATSPADLAGAELKLSAAAVLYARDARGGRLDPSRLSGLITPKLELPAADAVLTTLAVSSDAGAMLQAYNPPHPGYRALRAKLAELRLSRPAQPFVEVPGGPVLRSGMRDPRVPLIRARLNLAPSPDAADETAYDEQVAGAVAGFQRENGLRADGQLTRQTLAALGGRSPARLEADILANMERWRWLPGDLGARHILVNIPEYRLRVVDRGQVAHQTRVIVGRPETPTPVFTGAMDHAVVNPSWFVPPSILNKDFKGPNGEITARAGYEVIRRGGQVSVRQPPGPRNALGNIKFMFPNQHAVYLHDTPSRHLFSAERRALSHGCVRVDQPFALGGQLLAADGWTEARLKGLVGSGERTIRLSAQVPVHLTYFTISVDETGQVRHLDDLYGHHARVRRALGLGGGGEVNVASPRTQRQVRQQARPKPARTVRPAETARPARVTERAREARAVQAQPQPSSPPPARSLFGWLIR